MADLSRPSHAYGKFRDGNCPQADWYEIIDDWIHTFNASHWMAVPEKDHLVDALLNEY